MMGKLKLWLYGNVAMFMAADVLRDLNNATSESDVNARRFVTEMLCNDYCSKLILSLRDFGIAKKQTKKLLNEYRKLLELYIAEN